MLAAAAAFKYLSVNRPSVRRQEVRMMTERVIETIVKSPEHRSPAEMEAIVPWLRKRSGVLATIRKTILQDIIRNCEYRQCCRDDVIIKQGDIGDCFYIMLSGRASLYIDTSKSDDGPSDGSSGVTTPVMPDDVIAEKAFKQNKDGSLDRSQFGKFIIKYDAGKSFGEIALMNKDAVRNASIIADDPTDLLVVSRLLFNRSLKDKQEEEYKERKEFIANSYLFNKWISKFARLLEMSLRKEVYPYGCNIVKQGTPVVGLHFIIKGQAKLIVDPTTHKSQYPKLMQEMERSEVDDIRSRAAKRGNNQKENDLLAQHIRVRRREGYAAAERKIVHRKVDLCFVEEQETIGDIETVLGLPTYMHTVQCTANTEVLILDMKNYERLVARKNPQTIQIIKDKVIEKLNIRTKTPQGLKVPLVQHITKKLSPKPKTRISTAKSRQIRKKDVLMKQLVKLFLEGKAPMIEPCVPNSVYYRTKAQEKARLRQVADRRQQREEETAKSRLYGLNTRRPRSRRELEHLSSVYAPAVAPGAYGSRQTAYGDEDYELDELLARDHIHSAATTDDVFRFAKRDGENDDRVSKGSLINIIQELDGYQRVQSANRTKVITAVAHKENKHKRFDLLRPQSAPVMKSQDGEVEEVPEVESDSSDDFNDGEEQFDWETSDGGLRVLEDKIKKFCDEDKESIKNPSVQAMKRFEIKTQSDIPVPGGTVFVRRKECRYGSGALVGDHQHIRHFMLPKNAFQAIQLEKERMKHRQEYEERAKTPAPSRPRTAMSATKRTVMTTRKVRPHSAFVSRTADALV